MFCSGTCAVMLGVGGIHYCCCLYDSIHLQCIVFVYTTFSSCPTFRKSDQPLAPLAHIAGSPPHYGECLRVRFIAGRVQHFLPSSTRVELCVHMLKSTHFLQLNFRTMKKVHNAVRTNPSFQNKMYTTTSDRSRSTVDYRNPYLLL